MAPSVKPSAKGITAWPCYASRRADSSAVPGIRGSRGGHDTVRIYSMLYRVQTLRQRGRLLTQDELAAAPAVCGRLLTHRASSRFSRVVLVATLVDPRRHTADNVLLPPLYCVELLAIATLAIRL